MSKILLSPDFYLGPHYTKDVINMVPDASSLSPQSKWLGMISLLVLSNLISKWNLMISLKKAFENAFWHKMGFVSPNL